MNKLTRMQTLAILNEPNGSEKLFLRAEEAFDAAWTLFAEDANAQAAAFLARCAKRKAYRDRMNEALGAERLPLKAALAGEDAKLRKNAARLAGELGVASDAKEVIAALEKESVRMARPSMLLTLGALQTKEAKAFLESYKIEPPHEERAERHYNDEAAALIEALRSYEKLEKHEFRGLNEPVALELRTADMLAGSLAYELDKRGVKYHKVLQNAVLLTADDAALKKILTCRSYTELLFPLGRNISTEDRLKVKAVGEALEKLLLACCPAGDPSSARYGYRVEIRCGEGAMNADRATLAKTVVSYITAKTLANSTGDYEAELRIELGSRGANVYAKLTNMPDARFAYRKNALPASIHPATAAAALLYAREYLHENARVLDPCCGSGTMLIERGKITEVEAMTGVDIAHKAIDIARENAELAGAKAKFVRSDIRMFTARRPYDEVVANLPFGNRVSTHKENEELYAYILDNLPKWLKKGGVAILYTMEFTLLKKLVRERSALTLVTETRTEAGGLMPGIFIIKVK